MRDDEDSVGFIELALASARCIGMTLVAVRTVIHVPVHTLMVPVGIGFVGMFMATQAREDQIVLRIRMAGVACGRPAVCLREPCVVEGCTKPTRRRMATLASRREASCGVVRIRCVVEISLVATYARRVRNLVVTVNVALRTRH